MAPTREQVEHAKSVLLYAVDELDMSLAKIMNALEQSPEAFATAIAAAAASRSSAATTAASSSNSAPWAPEPGPSPSNNAAREEHGTKLEGGKAVKQPSPDLPHGTPQQAGQRLGMPSLPQKLQAVPSSVALIPIQLQWAPFVSAQLEGRLLQNADRLVSPWSGARAALASGSHLARPAALVRVTKVLLACAESGGRRILSSNDFVYRAVGMTGQSLPMSGYHQDSLRGAMLREGAARLMQNAGLDSGAVAALALTCSLGRLAREAAVGYHGGSTMLVVDADFLRGPSYHSNSTTGGRSASTINNGAAEDNKVAERLANIDDPESLVQALVELTADIDLSLCGPHCDLVPCGYAYNFWDLEEVSSTPVQELDSEGNPVLDENDEPVFLRSCVKGARTPRLMRDSDGKPVMDENDSYLFCRLCDIAGRFPLPFGIASSFRQARSTGPEPGLAVLPATELACAWLTACTRGAKHKEQG
ncbi:hypothetical protein ABPG75_010997 [Micractinium tetrahymenae]